jgi:hypothetical protein
LPHHYSHPVVEVFRRDVLTGAAGSIGRAITARAIVGRRREPSAQPLPIGHRGYCGERSRQCDGDCGVQKTSMTGDDSVPLRGERALEFIQYVQKAAHYLRRAGTVANDLSQGENEQAVEVPQFLLDSHRPLGVDPEAGRIGPGPHNSEEITDAIDGLYCGGGIVDRWR